jgi:histone H3/H4
MSDKFACEVTKRAIARAAAAFEFKNIQVSCVESLADIVRHFIQTVGEQARDFSENGGRAVPGIHDVIYALDMVSKHQLGVFLFTFCCSNVKLRYRGEI